VGAADALPWWNGQGLIVSVNTFPTAAILKVAEICGTS